MMEHLNESTDIVKSNRKLTGAVIANILLFLIMFVLAGLTPGNVYLLAGVFCLAAVSTAFLLYQIIKRL